MHLKRALLLFVFAIVFQASLLAQGAQLVVEVIDPDGLRIAEAEVVLTTPTGTPIRTATTSADGVASFPNLRPGGYSVEVTAPRFSPQVRRGVAISAAPVRLVIQLDLATVATTVEVLAPEAVLVAGEELQATELDEGSSTDLVESLRSVPGVNTLRRGGINLDPVIRGLRENQVLMLVDGTRTFAAGPARMDSELSHVDAGNISRVQVVKGPYALTEGSGGFSAIIVKTPEIPRFTGWTFQTTTTAGYSTNGAGRHGRVKIFAGMDRFGFSLRTSGRKGNDYEAGDLGVPQPNVPGDYSNHQFGGQIRFNPTRNQEITLASAYDEQTGIDYVGRLLDASHFITRSWSGGYHITDPAVGVRAINAKLYLNKKSHRMNNDQKPTALDMPGRIPPFGLEVSLPTESDTFGGAVGFDFEPSKQWRVRSGFDFYNLDQDAQRFVSRRSDGFLLFGDAVWPDASMNDQGAYIQAARRFERGEFAAALRLDFVQADAGRPTTFFLANTTGNVSQDEINTSFNVTGRYRLLRGVSLGGGFGRVVRSASVLERYSDRFPSTKFQIAAEFLGEPGIDPETSYQFDFGFDVILGNLNLQAGVFHQRIEHFITVALAPGVPRRLPLSPPTVFRYVSGDHANFRGFDFGVRYSFIPGLELSVQGAHSLADDIEESVAAIGVNEPASGIPPFEFRSALRYTEPQGRFWARFSARTVSDQDRVAVSRVEQRSPGFSTFDVLVGGTVARAFTFHFGVENLGDKRYFEHLNSLNPFTRQRVPERGRNFVFAFSRAW